MSEAQYWKLRDAIAANPYPDLPELYDALEAADAVIPRDAAITGQDVTVNGP